MYEDSEIIQKLNSNDEGAIEILFDQYYAYLCNVVYRVIHDYEHSEDVVQEIFMDLWRKRERIHIQSSLRAYLKRAAVNRGLNFLRKQRIKFDQDEDAVRDIETSEINGQLNLERSELEERIHEAIDSLPPRCKIVFGMSRFDQMSYQEIADALEISVKTVENQISKALKILRNNIHSYMVSQ